jgi:uncharacterized protein
MASEREFREEFCEGVRLFNEREFFACHDVLEELWTDTLGEERTFYQGLIHAAVSLFHFEEGNLGGARKMYDSTRRYLKPYLPLYMGIDLAGFLTDYETCFRPLLDAGSTWPAGVALDPASVPVLCRKGEAEHHDEL